MKTSTLAAISAQFIQGVARSGLSVRRGIIARLFRVLLDQLHAAAAVALEAEALDVVGDALLYFPAFGERGGNVELQGEVAASPSAPSSVVRAAAHGLSPRGLGKRF